MPHARTSPRLAPRAANWRALAAALAALCAAGLLAPPAGASEPTPQSGLIETVGRATVSVPADTVVFGFAVITRAETEQAARESHAGDLKLFSTYAVRAARPNGQVGSEATRVSPRTKSVNDDKGRRSEPDGFEATTVVRVRMAAGSAAQSMSREALTNGADRLVDTTYLVADPSAAQEKARAEAFADARRQAEHLAALSGLTLKRVVRVSLPPRDIGSALAGLGLAGRSPEGAGMRVGEAVVSQPQEARSRDGRNVQVTVTLDVAWSTQ